MRDEGSGQLFGRHRERAATRDVDLELSEFTQRVEREARHRRCREAQRLVVIGDGALWIWNLAGELFPQALQIVDRFNVKQRLGEVAQNLRGETSRKAKRWAERRYGELDEGRWKNLLAALHRHARHSKLAPRLRPTSAAPSAAPAPPGIPCSGPVHVFGSGRGGLQRRSWQRLKRTGMRTPSSPYAVASSAARFEDF